MVGNTDNEIGILGGGLTGLTLASLLDGRADVLEKENEVGGLCRSMRWQGSAEHA